jgi:HrpA-like RNA helicase
MYWQILTGILATLIFQRLARRWSERSLGLQHATNEAGMEALGDDLSPPDPSTLEPLYGFIPPHVKGKAVRKALYHDLNPFTKTLHTSEYKKFLKVRSELPVFGQMDEFLEMVCAQCASPIPRQLILLQFNKNQVLLVVAEPGSGKTTQCVCISATLLLSY